MRLVVAELGLAVLRARDQTSVLHTDRRIPNHWTTRQVPPMNILINIHLTHAVYTTGFPGGSVVKNPLHCGSCRRPGFNPLVGKFPRRRAQQPTPVFLPGESCGQRSLAGYSHRVARFWTWLGPCIPLWFTRCELYQNYFQNNASY